MTTDDKDDKDDKDDLKKALSNFVDVFAKSGMTGAEWDNASIKKEYKEGEWPKEWILVDEDGDEKDVLIEQPDGYDDFIQAMLLYELEGWAYIVPEKIAMLPVSGFDMLALRKYKQGEKLDERQEYDIRRAEAYWSYFNAVV